MVKIDQESRKKPNINNTKKYQELFELHNAIYYHLNKGGIYKKLNEITDVFS